jgi:O-antigen/teichoic acid export membrane protein
LHLLDRVDDLWVGTYLDNIAMGLYSRAYTFATYPRKLVAGPVQSVSIGTYAELKEDHTRLSQAFYRTNALLVRVSFLFGGILSLVAPELIHLLLGEKWLPMLDVFRLMLIYTLFDPIKLTVANIFVAVGKPEKVALVRALQFVIMVVGLYTLGPRFGIAGVAIAVDLMLVVGIVVLFWQVRAYVDYSLRMLLQVPLVALLLGLALSYTMMEIPAMQVLNWYTGLAKGGVFIVVYVSTLLFLEFGNVRKIVAFISGALIDRVDDEEIVDNG